MRIAEVTAMLIDVPLKREIRHASHVRSDSQNVLVRCRLASGVVGWGEGVPRSYVTGETADSTIEMFAATDLAEQLAGECDDWPDVIRLCDSIRLNITQPDDRDCRGNALRCAIELSLLDAFGRQFDSPVWKIIEHLEEAAPIRKPVGPVRYSTTLTAETPRRERISALKMRVYGFAQCKVKVGLAGQDEAARLGRIRRWLGRSMDIRVDANEAWEPDEAAEKLQSLAPLGITAAEQPVAHANVTGLAEVRRRVDIPIMLDESLTSLADARHAVAEKTCDLFNIRLSKCGGYLNSLRIAAFANRNGIGYQLGCHPGETGVLSAAGRHFASSVANIRYVEGSYDRHLLKVLPTNEDITFGYGGRAAAMIDRGLGVTIHPGVLKRIVHQASTRTHPIGS